MTCLKSLTQSFENAGLEAERAWVAEGCVGRKEYAVENGSELFEKVAGAGGASLRRFVKEERRKEVREGFVKR